MLSGFIKHGTLLGIKQRIIFHGEYGSLDNVYCGCAAY
jgi:hypothetical protein